MPNPCHSDAGGALPGTVEVVVLFEDSGTLALFRERGTGFKPKRCQASHAFRLSPPVPGFLVEGHLDGSSSNTVYRFLHLLAHIHDSFYRGGREFDFDSCYCIAR